MEQFYTVITSLSGLYLIAVLYFAFSDVENKERALLISGILAAQFTAIVILWAAYLILRMFY